MNEKQWREHKARVKKQQEEIRKGADHAVQNFRHFIKIGSSHVVIEHQVTKAFMEGVALGEKIGKGEL